MAAVVAALYPATPQPASAPRLAAPDFEQLRVVAGPISDVSAPVRVRRRLAASFWNGGTYQDSQGETFRIFQSSSYVDDPSIRQSWTSFFGWLPHGSELSRLTVYMAPLQEVEQLCGASAEGCYSPSLQSMIVPGDRREVNMDQIMAHEYGHHIAANRSNDPWSASAYGPKYWATYANVCQRVDQGSAVPGDEGSNYPTNPGEAFADTYRFMVGTRNPGPDWNTPGTDPFIAPSFPLDAGAYAAVLQDALAPWAGPTEGQWTGTLRRPQISQRIRRIVKTRHGRKIVWTTVAVPRPGSVPIAETELVETPRDGLLQASIVSAPPDASLTIMDASGTAVIGPQGVPSASFTVCGQRDVTLVLRSSTPGDFAVSVSTP